MKKKTEAPPEHLANSKVSPYFTKKRLAVLAVIWGVSITWICLVELPLFSFIKNKFTDKTVESLAGLIEAYKKAKKKTPDTLASLREFARESDHEFGIYDAYGNRLSYTRLGKQYYLIRSFGEDEVQNRPTSAPDRAKIRGGAFPKGAALTYDFQPDTPPSLFPGILLEGSDSADGGWHARLYNNREDRISYLVVRKKTPSGIIMSAPHDRVEEFFWVPGRLQIVYSVTASGRAPDGIYLWDLTTDQVTNLLAKKPQAGHRDQIENITKNPKFWISLAGISEKGPTVFAFVAPRHDGGLDARDFFRSERLISLNIPDSPRDKPTQTADLTRKKALSIGYAPVRGLDELLRETYVSRDRIRGLPYRSVQRHFLALPLRGEPEPILVAWNHFANRVVESPIFPYGLWILTNLYSQAHENLIPHASKEADVLRSYGTEIANALLNDPLAPSYLKALALDAHQRLLTGSPLPYRVGSLSKPMQVKTK